MQLREASLADAVAACEVMRRSIIELCGADHHDDSAILARWLANKTPEHFASWLAQADNHVFVAVEADQILGVGAVTDSGEITLNHVSPAARFRGVSRAMVAQLEARARELGNIACMLTSTETAQRFYRALGYVEQGPPKRLFGTDGHPMARPL